MNRSANKRANLNLSNNNSLTLGILFLVNPLLAVPSIYKLAKNGNLFAGILWSIFLSTVGFLVIPNHDVLVHWKYYDMFLARNVTSFLVEWKHDFILTFVQYSLAKLGIEHHYVVFIFIFVASTTHLLIYRDFINRRPDLNRDLAFLAFFFFFPLFGIISGLRNSLAIELFTVGIYLLYTRNRTAYSLLFFALACMTHFSMLFLTSIAIVIYFLPFRLLNISRKNAVLTTVLLGITSYLLVNLIFSFLANTVLQDKVEIYGVAGDLDYIELKSFKWRIMYYLQKILSLFYIILFFRNFKGTKLDILVLITLIIIAGTINYTIISNRFITSGIALITLSILNNLNTDNKKNTNTMINLVRLSASIFVLYLIQNYFKFIISYKLSYLLFVPFPVLISDPYTNQEYAQLFLKL